MIIAHLSDPHFGTELPALTEALQRALARIRPDLIILSGDITQRARRGQFRRARAYMEALGIPFLAIPGNHDVPLYDMATRFLWPNRLYGRYFGAREFRRVVRGTAFVGLDATRRLLHTRGRLDAVYVDTVLTDARRAVGEGGLIMVAIHQPLSTAWAQDTHEALIDAETIDAAFCRHRIDLVMSGHVHVPLLSATDKLFPETPWSYVFSGAGTVISRRVRAGAPNSFNLIQIKEPATPPQIRLSMAVYDAEANDFYLRDHAEFAKTPQGWRLS